MTLHPRRKIELMLDAPLVPRIERLLIASGLDHYTLLPMLGGRGHSGSWREDDISGLSKVMLLSLGPADAADRFVEALRPLLGSHHMILIISDVDVVRSERF
jgi:hypothetical protein